MLTELLPRLFPDLRVEECQVTATKIILTLTPLHSLSACPVCSLPTGSVHSEYSRTLADLPCCGTSVVLKLKVRKYFCRNKACRRKIFTERLPHVVQPYRRQTDRLHEEQRQLALAHGGAAAARTAQRQGFPASAKTHLRRILHAPLRAVPTPRLLGVDDWAMRKGQTYGTILVDLEQHRPIDLLTDRSSASLERWLRDHPGVEIITRDRSHDYAEGALRGAPEAIQVADRFHLVKNVYEVLQKVLERHHTCLRAATRIVNEHRLAELAPSHGATSGSQLQHELPSSVASDTDHVLNESGTSNVKLSNPQQLIQENRARRYARYLEVQRLHTEGVSMRQIAVQLGTHYRTVRRFVVAQFPERAARPPVRTILDPHIPYLMEQLKAGRDNSMQLWRELRDQHGYQGSRATVSRWVVAHRALCPPNPSIKRKGRPPSRTQRPSPPQFRTPSARATAWMLLADVERLDDLQAIFVDQLLVLCPEANLGRSLTRQFHHIVKERDSQAFEQWLAQVKSEHIPEFATFVAGLRRDDAAVRAALSLPYSNGQTEGQITRLKLIKRSMYGRASFQLLKQRVLAA
jgi:transposase